MRCARHRFKLDGTTFRCGSKMHQIDMSSEISRIVGDAAEETSMRRFYRFKLKLSTV